MSLYRFGFFTIFGDARAANIVIAIATAVVVAMAPIPYASEEV